MRSLDALHRVDEVCLRFEDDWRAGRRPGAAAYLARVPAGERELLLAELLLLEWDYRYREGESFYFDEYARRHAEMRAAVEQAWARWKEQEHKSWETVPPDEKTPMGGATTPHIARPAAFAPPGYEQVELLSKGGMGEVYRAFDPRLARWVALKQVRIEQATPEALARFRREAEALARLAHPHIVKVHGYAEHEGQPLLEMEYVAGGTLEGRLKAPVAPEEAARLVAVVAWAVHAAHEKGVVHRDLKPANVLMDDPVPGDSGNVLKGYPKVSDFGLAAVRDAVSGQTVPGSVLGTPAYMAPEQAMGRSREVGPASDVWALGVILYRALAGALPFEGDSVLETLDRVKTMQMRPLREAAPGVPAELSEVVAMCLQKEPGQRPTAKELAERLEAAAAPALKGRAIPNPALPGPEGPGYPNTNRLASAIGLARPFRAGGRHLLAVAGAAAAVACVLVAAWVWWPRDGGKPDDNGTGGTVTAKDEPLAIRLRVTHHKHENKEDQEIGIFGFDSQAARYEDRVGIEVQLNQPGYFYLIGLNFDGKEQLLWPGADEAPVRTQQLKFPPPHPRTGKAQAIKLDDDPGGGTQVFLVVAARTALPAYSRWAKERGASPWKQLPPIAGVWRSDGATLDKVNKGDIRVRGSVVQLEGQPPLLGVTGWAKGPEVEAVEAIAFPVNRR